MFWPNVVELKQFYASPLGQVACRAIQKAVARWWPEAKEETLVGIGYTTPYLRLYHEKSMLNIAFMPAEQGALYWPASGHNLTALVNEAELPLKDNLVNRVICAHSLENSEQRLAMLQEAWRILTPGGRLLLVVPNRRGIWARASDNPFSHGQPFSHQQLKKALSEAQFTPTRSTTALFLPPLRWTPLHRLANMVEAIGRFAFGMFGGVLLMEAEKQIYASTKEVVTVKQRRRYVKATAGASVRASASASAGAKSPGKR